ncbi:MAG TPA: hypothetical protein VF507_01115 [Pyrinomonadaceae bacterium]
MSANLQRPPDEELPATLSDGLSVKATSETLTLGELPLGARLVLRCRKDWRVATVVAVAPEGVRLSVCSPTGRTYRLRRPHTSLLTLYGGVPALGAGHWRVHIARYDTRW